LQLKVIAHMRNDFSTKFGLPRQSGLVEAIRGRIVFEEDYRVADALRGMEGFSHLWLIWGFSEAVRQDWKPTVRPPRLGGNKRLGVFATRSPFRPNALGLSCVRLEGIDYDCSDGPAIIVSGVDMMDGTPIYDIKPYIPYADCRPEARGSFADVHAEDRLEVVFPEALLALVPAERRETLLSALAQDPRPAYQRDPSRIYGLPYAGLDIKFSVADGILTVHDLLTP